jgi:molybdate transport system substrate-binding protein
MSAVRRLIGISVCVVIMAAGLVRAEDRELTAFAAGSLREALGVIAEDFGAVHKIRIRTEFGPSGRLRERIERGEHADLFASADIGHARTLVEQGRATVIAMFARNSICALAPEGLGLTEATIVDKLLDKATKIGISTPKADPLGDYTVEVYHRISQDHAGAADGLMSRSTVSSRRLREALNPARETPSSMRFRRSASISRSSTAQGATASPDCCQRRG